LSPSTLSNAAGGLGISSGATVGRTAEDNEFVIDTEDPLITELQAINPGVLRVQSPKSYSLKRIIRHLLSVPIGDSLACILSIHRSTGSKVSLIEIFHPEYRAKILSSANLEPFPFDISATANITSKPNTTVCGWISQNASIHLRINIPYLCYQPNRGTN
jgi:hypothetical protein